MERLDANILPYKHFYKTFSKSSSKPYFSETMGIFNTTWAAWLFMFINQSLITTKYTHTNILTYKCLRQFMLTFEAGKIKIESHFNGR